MKDLWYGRLQQDCHDHREPQHNDLICGSSFITVKTIHCRRQLIDLTAFGLNEIYSLQ
jgi:hypothetical protein